MKNLILTILLVATYVPIFSAESYYSKDQFNYFDNHMRQVTKSGDNTYDQPVHTPNYWTNYYNSFAEFHAQFYAHEEQLARQNEQLDQLEHEVEKTLKLSEKQAVDIISPLGYISDVNLRRHVRDSIKEKKSARQERKINKTTALINDYRSKNNDHIADNAKTILAITLQCNQAKDNLDSASSRYELYFQNSFYKTEGNNQLPDQWQLLSDMSNAQYELSYYQLQQRLLDASQKLLDNNNKEYDHALSLLYPSNHESEIAQRWKQICHKSLLAMQKKEILAALHHESDIAQRWKRICDKTLLAMRKKDIIDAQVDRAHTLMKNYIISWKINKEVAAQAKIAAEIAQAQQEKKERAQKEKALRKQQENRKIQEAQLAAEKKAEQSKTDKERHLMLQEDKLSTEQRNRAKQSQLAKERKAAAQLAAAKKLDTQKPQLTESCTSKKNKKKKNTPLTPEETIEVKEQVEFAEQSHEEISDEAIALCILNDVKMANYPIHIIDGPELTPLNIKALLANITHTSDIEKYNQFMQWRHEKLVSVEKEIEAAKIATKKENLTKLLRCKAADRDALKAKQEKEFKEKYNSSKIVYASSDEKKIMELLHRYHDGLFMRTMNEMTLEQFARLKNLIVSADLQLTAQKKQLKWYLMMNPELYKHIKQRYIVFKNTATLSGIEAAEDRYNYCISKLQSPCPLQQSTQLKEELEKLTPIYNNIQKFKELQSLHENNGILDITDLLYTLKTYDEIDCMGILPPDTLQKGTDAIKIMYQTKANSKKIMPIIVNLFEQAGINPSQQLTNYLLTMVAKQTSNETKINDLHALTTLSFLDFQKATEMSEESYTQDQIADIIKIHICLVKADPNFTE